MTVSHRAREQGASLVEFALVCGVFFFLLLTFIDFVRILSVQVALTTGAQKGLQLAQRIPGGELDIRTSAATDDLYRRYAEARRQVLDLAVSFPAATFVDPSNRPASASQLRGFQHRDLLTTGANPSAVADAILLRPGEQAISSDGQTIIDHPTICPLQGPYSSRACLNIPTPPSPAPPETRRRITPTDKWSDLLQQAPLMVELCANVQLFIPGFREPVRTCRRALGYRVVPQSAGPGAGSFTPTTLVCQPNCSCLQVKTPGEGCSCSCPANAASRCSGNTPDFNPNTCCCTCNQKTCSNPTPDWNQGACQCVCYQKPCSVPTPDWNAGTCSCYCNRDKCPQGQIINESCQCVDPPPPPPPPEGPTCQQVDFYYPPQYGDWMDSKVEAPPPNKEDKCDALCKANLGSDSYVEFSKCVLETSQDQWGNKLWKIRAESCCKCVGRGRTHDGSAQCCPEVPSSQLYVKGRYMGICCGMANWDTGTCSAY